MKRTQLKRTAMKPRRSRLARTTMVRRPRTMAETVRAHGDVERREWMKRQPCVICGRVPSDAAHVKTGGTGRKADAQLTAPLCSDTACERGHHSEYDGRKHAGGKRTFEAKYGVDMLDEARKCQARYDAWRAAA